MTDLLAGLRASYLLRAHFRYVSNTGLLVLRRAGGKTLRRGALRGMRRRFSTGCFPPTATFR